MNMNNISRIQKNIEEIRRNIPDSVELLGAVKTRSVDEVQAAFDAGMRFFGHNYVQEAQAMISEVEFKASWHLIGHLQRNKAKFAVELFDMVESLDSLRLAKELEKRCAEAGKKMPVLIEVNSGREENKTGVMPEDALALADWLNGCEFLRLSGLMTMGPLTGDPELSRPYYKETKRLAEEIGSLHLENVRMDILSMGMSNSYQVAVEEGATLIRLGTVIFGPRYP